MIGQNLGHYKIIEKLGEGGMGVVYRAEDTHLKRQVALKVLPPELSSTENRLKRFQREAEALAALDHPNIVTIHSVEEADGVHFLTMQLVEGKSLASVITSEGMPLDQVFETSIAIADALVAAHERGIVHRDLKPGNIVIAENGRVMVLDFGIAKLIQNVDSEDSSEVATETLTVDGRAPGTLPYMSPEQIEGKNIDARSDIFSLGIILYEMATGQRPFKGESSVSLMASILREDPLEADHLKPELPRHLGRVINRCLQKNPDRRFLVAKGLRNELEELRKEVSTARAYTDPTATAPIARPTASKSIRIGMVLLILFAIARIWWMVQNRQESTVSSGLSESPMIAVLPFENLGPPKDQYFADGMTEEITTRLAGVQGLRVISRTSANQYRDNRPPIKQIADELGVDFLLEGTVRWARSEDGVGRVRVTPQLIRVKDDIQIWSESYDRLIEDVFRIQSDVATQVAAKLDVTLLDRERQAIESQPTENLEAYHAYLNGLGYVVPLTWSGADMDQAIQLFQRAVELDPEFISAYYRLSRTHLWHSFVVDPSREHIEAGRVAAEHTVALDPSHPEAHLAMGYYHYLGHRNYDAAYIEFEKAFLTRPNDSEVLAALAYIDRRRGRFDSALERLRSARELDPRSAQRATDLGATLMFTRRSVEARAYLEESIALDPDQVLAYVRLAETYWFADGDLVAARQVLESSPRSNTSEMTETFIAQSILERDYETALELLSTDRDIQSSHHPRALSEARIHRQMGNDLKAEAAFQESRVLLEEILDSDPPDRWWAHCYLGQTLAGLGLTVEAFEQAELASVLFPIDKDPLEGPHLAFRLVFVYTLAGDYDEAIDRLEVLMGIKGFWAPTVPILEIDPSFDELRDKPRFQAMLDEYR